MGIDSSKIKTHSFQIGAASCHFERGTPHEGIKRVSRWKSDVFKTYIRKVWKYNTQYLHCFSHPPYFTVMYNH
jgi:hypothetical protein